VSSPVSFGRKVVAPLLQGFNRAFPDISIELLLDDARHDFVADRIDVAFCNGRMEDSQVVAKQLMPMRLLVCASAAYARERGLPRMLEELAHHRCVHLRLPSGRICDWEFKVDGTVQRLLPPARNTFNDDDVALQAVLDGQGLAQLAGYQVSELLRTGQLFSCLEAYAPDDRGHYICFSSRRQLPSRIRVFVDHMTQQIRGRQAQPLEQLAITA
jgi:DNA-binding transcriptional LysR family regulator